MIFAIKPFEIHDGDGIRTTVFFKGCPLRCKWCHNPESFHPKRQMLFDPQRCLHCMDCTDLCDANIRVGERHEFLRENCNFCGECLVVCPREAFSLSGEEMTAGEIAGRVLQDAPLMKASGGGVTFSGGEPLLQKALCVELAGLLKAQGIHIAVDTCGYVGRDAIEAVAPYVDTFLFDIKAIDRQTHIRCTGVSNEWILKNIRFVDSLGIPTEIRYPLVPGYNDGEAAAIGNFCAGLSHMKCLRLLPYHSYAQDKYRCLGLTYPIPGVEPPTTEQIETALTALRACGIDADIFR